MLHTFDLPQFASSDQLASRQEQILLVCDKLIRISLNLNPNQHCKPDELTEIISSLSPESLIGIKGKQQLDVEDVLNTIAAFNSNYLIPNGFALSVNYFGRPEVVFAQISLDSLREQEYLDGKLLHGKMNIIHRTNDTCGMTFGNLALTDPELSKKSSEGLYNLIMSGQIDREFSVAKLLREDFERQNFGLEDYTEHFGYSRIDHEEIAHAKNNIYTKSLNKNRQNQGLDSVSLAQAVLKPDCDLDKFLTSSNHHPMVENIVNEHAAQTMGIIAEMNHHLSNQAFKLAYYAALDFLLVKMMHASSPKSMSQSGLYDSTSSMFLSTLPELGIESPQQLLSLITEGKYQDRAKACLGLFERIYQHDLLGNKARLRSLM